MRSSMNISSRMNTTSPTKDIKQSVLDALKEGCEENASTFEDIADTLESEVGLSGVHVRLVYLNGDGSEIYTHDFE